MNLTSADWASVVWFPPKLDSLRTPCCSAEDLHLWLSPQLPFRQHWDGPGSAPLLREIALGDSVEKGDGNGPG